MEGNTWHQERTYFGIHAVLLDKLLNLSESWVPHLQSDEGIVCTQFSRWPQDDLVLSHF